MSHYIAFQGLPKDDTQSVTIATSIMDGKFATAAATGDFTSVMQLTSVLAGILTPTSGGRRLLLGAAASGDNQEGSQQKKVLGRDHPGHPTQLAKRQLQDADEIREIQQQVMDALTTIVIGAKPPSHVIYQYLAAVADIAWGTINHKQCTPILLDIHQSSGA